MDVGPRDAFEQGKVAPVRLGNRTILICCTDDGVFAVANRCTHVAWLLDDAPLDGCELLCELHGGRFDVRSGEATAAPASKPLETFEVEVRDGRVWVRSEVSD